MFVASVIDDKEKGTLTSVALAKSTAGNSNNSKRPHKSVHAVFRNMPVHDDALMGAFVYGLLPKEPLEDIAANQQ